MKKNFIPTKFFLAAIVEGSLSVITDFMEAAVVCFGGTLVDMISS